MEEGKRKRKMVLALEFLAPTLAFRLILWKFQYSHFLSDGSKTGQSTSMAEQKPLLVINTVFPE